MFSTELFIAHGLRLFSAAAALVRAPEAFFARNPIETQVALASLRDASDLLRHLLDGGRTVKAGQLAGALRRIGRATMADEIVNTMKAAGYVVRETDPFAPEQTFGVVPEAKSPIVVRMRAMWESMRAPIAEIFPKAPGLPNDKAQYLNFVDDIYKNDAYHSLSIEGYSVTPALIEKVQRGDWDPKNNDADKKDRDALAARGYFQAFQSVKGSIEKILAGENPGALVRVVHKDWYRELFQPSVAAGLLPAGTLAGYRNDAVYLRTSRYVPPRWEAVRDAMPELSTRSKKKTMPASGPYSGTGCSAISIHTLTATGGWRVSS